MSYFLPCILYFFAYGIVTSKSSRSLKQRLSTWHTLKQEDLQLHRHKRSLNDDSVTPLDKEISFNAFDQTFHLSLMPSTELFSSNFKAYVESRHESRELLVDKGSVMEGKLLDDPDSDVTAHYDGKLLTANIRTKNETYIVEPMWRHIPKPQASHKEHSSEQHRNMLVYRTSDLNLDQFKDPHSKNGFCDTEDLMRPYRDLTKRKRRSKDDAVEPEVDSSNVNKRAKRSSGNLKKICKLTLVADHRFYKEMGNSSELITMYYLINLMGRVNRIYKSTDWDPHTNPGVLLGYGFQIDKIRIFNESTRMPRYNSAGFWEAKRLLEAFSEEEHSDCLAHLFTYIDFRRGLLGLAYVGSEKADDVGGICTKPHHPGKGKPKLYLNTGLTSTVNWGEPILTTEADLVTAHELGHNFGAEHDEGSSGSSDCTPGQSRGGNYIMYPAAVSGTYENNDKFSECSKHNILPSLLNKAPSCFQEDKKSFCGNYRIEKDDNETCDVGYLLTPSDRCCFANCTLKQGAVCSNKNYPCCTDDCQVAKKSKLCKPAIPLQCLQDSYCDGVSYECPPALPIDNGEPCGEDGKCKNGKCEQFCYTKNLQPCLCSKKEDYCYRCCAPKNLTGDDMIDNCKPYRSEGPDKHEWPKLLSDYSTCVLGYCLEGKCHKNTQDVIERVWDIFKYIAPDKIGEFLADNIVGAVLVFSLLFWIPCSCLINFVDKRRLQERRKEEKWLTEHGGEYSRSFVFKGTGGGSAPVTPRIRIQRNNTNWNSGGVAIRSGFGAQDQWRASQERAMVMRKSSEENLDERLSIVPGSPNNSDGLSRSQPSLTRLSASNSEDLRPNFVRAGVISPSKSHQSLTSPLSPSFSEKSFDGDVKPIAASSTTDLSAPVDDGDMVETIVNSDPRNNFAHYRRRSTLHRQEAVVSPK